MTDEMIEVGQVVRIRDQHRRGIVREIDHELYVARLGLRGGAEEWVRLDELEAIPVWNRTEPQSGAHAA